MSACMSCEQYTPETSVCELYGEKTDPDHWCVFLVPLDLSGELYAERALSWELAEQLAALETNRNEQNT